MQKAETWCDDGNFQLKYKKKSISIRWYFNIRWYCKLKILLLGTNLWFVISNTNSLLLHVNKKPDAGANLGHELRDSTTGCKCSNQCLNRYTTHSSWFYLICRKRLFKAKLQSIHCIYVPSFLEWIASVPLYIISYKFGFSFHIYIYESCHSYITRFLQEQNKHRIMK